MQQPQRAIFAIHYNKGGKTALHARKRLTNKRIGRDGLRVRCHNSLQGQIQYTFMLEQKALKIPVADHPGQTAFRIKNKGNTAILAVEYRKQGLPQGGILRYAGDILALHEGLNLKKHPPRPSGGVIAGKILAPERPPAHERYREGIAKRQHNGSRGCGREVERAGFSLHPKDNRDIGHAREGTFRSIRYTDNTRREAFDMREHIDHLSGFAALGKKHHRILRAENAKIPVRAFRRMQEERRSAGA